MVFPHEHVLLRFQGMFASTTPPGLDQWSVGMRFGNSSNAPIYDAAKLQTFVNAAKTAANTFHTTAGVGTGTNTYLYQVTGAQIGVLGNYVPTSQQTVVSPGAAVAGVGTGVQPWSSALVFSLRTAAPRGLASNGRVYWPAVGTAVDASTGRVSPASIATRLDAFRVFVNALNTAANIYHPGISLVVASAVGGGQIRPVTSVRADGRMDNIERRENAIPVTYQSVAIP